MKKISESQIYGDLQQAYSSVVLNFTALLDEVQCGVCFWKALFFVLTTLWELLMPDISHDVAVIILKVKHTT